MLIRDVANWDRDDDRFPFLRNFDPCAGHAHASGHAAFANGNRNPRRVDQLRDRDVPLGQRDGRRGDPRSRHLPPRGRVEGDRAVLVRRGRRDLPRGLPARPAGHRLEQRRRLRDVVDAEPRGDPRHQPPADQHRLAPPRAPSEHDGGQLRVSPVDQLRSAHDVAGHPLERTRDGRADGRTHALREERLHARTRHDPGPHPPLDRVARGLGRVDASMPADVPCYAVFSDGDPHAAGVESDVGPITATFGDGVSGCVPPGEVVRLDDSTPVPGTTATSTATARSAARISASSSAAGATARRPTAPATSPATARSTRRIWVSSSVSGPPDPGGVAPAARSSALGPGRRSALHPS